jgi:hypothetical protein
LHRPRRTTAAPRRSRPRSALPALLLAAGLFCWAGGSTARAQQGYRESLAGEAASAGRRAADNGDYNLLLGPIRLKVKATLGVEYNDNVFAAGEGQPKQSDLFIRPGVSVNASWQITQLNRLSLTLGTSYEFSLNNTRDQSVSPYSISPDSRLSFDLFIGDFRITFFDAFSLANNAASQSAASGTIGFSQFSNDFGITVLWDLNDLILSATIDERSDVFTGKTTQGVGATDLSQANRETHSLTASATFLLSDTTSAGLQGTAALSSYSAGAQEQTIFGLGPFAQFQLSPYTRFLAAGGAQLSKSTGGPSLRATVNLRPEQSTAAGDQASTVGYYWSLGIYNRLNASITHSLSAGHERVFGIAADYQDIDYIRYEATWALFRHANVSGSLGYENVGQLAGPLQESFTRWTFGLASSYQLTDHLHAALRYTFYSQDANRADRIFNQTVVALTLGYDF